MAELLPLAHTIIASDDFRWYEDRDADGPGARAPWSALAHAEQVVTHGADPVEWWTGDASGHVTVPAVTVRDTLGAGDAFHGAFAYYASRSRARDRTPARTGDDATTDGGRLREHLAAAADVAALRCSVVGPREWLGLLSQPVSRRSR
jgi:sugar/nucleoside kinase (ribokinase family)